MIMSTAFTAVGDLFSPGTGTLAGSDEFRLRFVQRTGTHLGGYIVDHFDWHWVFWIFLPVGVVAFFLILRLFPSAETGEKNGSITSDRCF